MPTPRLPTYFVSHGGGPWPWMQAEYGDAYAKLRDSLAAMPREIGQTPKAVLVVSAHWEERDFTVMTSAKPPMIYDYGGFPDYTYKIQYPAPGAPAVATRVKELLDKAGLSARLDANRGFDHGTYAPLVCIYPNADVPVLQLSLRKHFDPRSLYDAGKALAQLRDEGVLIVGSGLSYHNLRLFDRRAHVPSGEFDAWLHETLMLRDVAVRRERLWRWSEAPSARLAHPREEHLLPVMLAAGAAEGETTTRVYHEDDFLGGIVVSSYRFGDI